jgi:hypothetical protein
MSIVGVYDISSVEKDIIKVFQALPPSFRERAVGQIYQRALIPMRDAIRNNAPSASKTIVFRRKGSKYVSKPGTLKRSISIKYLAPRGVYQYPAAMVYIKDRINDGWYAHFLEYGTQQRTTERAYKQRNQRKGANRGQIEGRFFFRRGMDQTFNMVEYYVKDALSKYSEKILQQQLQRVNLKSRKIKIDL